PEPRGGPGGDGAAVLAAASGAVWAALTADFAARRVARASRTPAESARLVLTSLAIPPAACWYRALGEVRHRRVRPAGPPEGHGRALPRMPAAVLFDRDGTLVHDVPYNGDPARVVPVEGAREALERLRGRGVPVGVVSNQSGVARGLVSHGDLDRVNARIEELLGPFDVWRLCVHGEEDGCSCRKPRPGLVRRAARSLGVPARRCVVIGDTGGDVAAAAAAGARPILVPNGRTRPEERRDAPEVAETLGEAVELAIRGVDDEGTR
uniref:D-glycero-alpha-D-manno-heptose-1,7-bisphosphate 7-phosphatase n=1 Tax=Allosalinactinospora lopnorensis TaxID=1352348 RepID=UPI000623D369